MVRVPWSCRGHPCAAVASLPSLLERRQRADQALFGVVIEAYLPEASNRRVDDLVKALGSRLAFPGPTSTRSALLFGFGGWEDAGDDMPGRLRRSRVDIPGSTTCMCTVFSRRVRRDRLAYPAGSLLHRLPMYGGVEQGSVSRAM